MDRKKFKTTLASISAVSLLTVLNLTSPSSAAVGQVPLAEDPIPKTVSLPPLIMLANCNENHVVSGGSDVKSVACCKVQVAK